MSAGPVVPLERRLLELHPIVAGSVELAGGFWGDRQRLNREVTIPYGMKMLEESGTIENLRIAAGRSRFEYRLPLFRDSDLYKVLEAIAWERAHGSDADQEVFFASSVEVIGAAQEPDGYVNSYVQVVEGGHRFGNPAMGHELYCAGHLTQAAVADLRTSKQPGELPAIANRFANLLVDVMPTEEASYVPGHPEIETALAELYRTNGDGRLIELVAELIGRRGRGSLSWHQFGPSYFQDDVAFDQATTIRGHAVRALYLLAGATDLYTETGRPELLKSILDQWRDMVSAKTYITGGIGSRHKDEGFGDAYELPPDRAYCETCAAIASVMWNWRLLLLTGDRVYADLVERTLYNAVITSVGFDCTSFFYENALQSRTPSVRQPWYDCACCPPNLMRLLASLEHYVATQTDQGVQLHQYVPGRITVDRGPGRLELEVATGYPFDGTVAVSVLRAPDVSQEIAFRVPSWAGEARLFLGGRPVTSELSEKGYLHVRKDWQPGDEIVLELPLRPRLLGPAREIDAVRGCVALERGPLVYCVEGIDLPKGASLDGLCLDTSSVPREEAGFDVAGHTLVSLLAQGHVKPTPSRAGWPYVEEMPADGEEVLEDEPSRPAERVVIRANPYYSWANRGATTMRVWVPRR